MDDVKKKLEQSLVETIEEAIGLFAKAVDQVEETEDVRTVSVLSMFTGMPHGAEALVILQRTANAATKGRRAWGYVTTEAGLYGLGAGWVVVFSPKDGA
jgi:hypothetical protein